MSEKQWVPDGFEEVPCVRAWSNGKHVVIEFEADEEDDWHSCDEMGCGWSHVLARFELKQLDGVQRLIVVAPYQGEYPTTHDLLGAEAPARETGD